MMYDMEHLFICLFSFLISSLMRCLLKSLTFFFSWVVFLLLSFKYSSYILDNSSLSDICFADISSLIRPLEWFTGKKWTLYLLSTFAIMHFILQYSQISVPYKLKNWISHRSPGWLHCDGYRLYLAPELCFKVRSIQGSESRSGQHHVTVIINRGILGV